MRDYGSIIVFILLLSPLLVWLGNLQLFGSLLMLNAGVYIYVWLLGVNSVWIMPIMMHYVKRERSREKSFESQNRFSVEWVQSRAIDEYVELVKKAKP